MLGCPGLRENRLRPGAPPGTLGPNTEECYMRRLLAILALVIGLGLLAGCTNTGNTAGGSGAGAPPSGGSSAPGGSCGGGAS